MMLSEAFGLPDHDRVPTEIASRFDTPEKADAYAADIIEWCRWAALPPAERGEAAREWWCASQGDHADAARAYLAALPAEQRAAMVSSWLKELSSYAGNCLWLAWRWHSGPENKTDAPIRPSLLVATAAVLGLVAGWDANGRPVPARAIREILGLPNYNDLPAFLAAARMDADAARRGKTMTDRELAALVNVTAMSIRKWRPDFGRFSDSVLDNFFPLGLPALANGSGTVNTVQVEGTLTSIAETVSAKRAAALSAIDNHGRTDQHKRRRPNTASMSVEPRVALFKAALHIMLTGSTVPTELPIAFAHILGMVSPVSGRILVGSDTLGAVGLPDVDDPEKFRNAARLEGEWLRKRIEQMQPDESRITFKKAWERAANDIETSEVLQRWFADKVHDCLDEGWLAVGADAVARKMGSGRKGRSTVADWKKKQEYRRLVHDAAIWPVVIDFAWRRWRGTRATLPSN